VNLRRAGTAVALTGAFLAPVSLAAAHTPTSVTSADPRIGFAGRWERHYAGGEAATVNSGSRIGLTFTGRRLTGLFDVSTITVPPELWVTVDGGPESLVTVDRPEIELAPDGLRPGVHQVRIDVKDTDQVTNRWLTPLGDAVIVRGFRLPPGERLLPPPRPAPVRMAFFGDSITEGIRALGQPLTPDGADGTRTYAGVAGRAFHADLQLVGFGKQGVMRDGVGNVPTAPESFPYNFGGSAADPGFRPDVVVLLQGSNDSAVTDEEFAPAYASYLREVRAADPQAWIFAMEPLIGRHSDVIRSDVAETGDPRTVFVDTDGWLDRHSTADYTDTVHPTVAGHLKVAAKLIPIIGRATGLPVWSSPVRVTVPEVTRDREDLTADVHIEQVLSGTRYAASGTVLITPPPGLTVDRDRRRYRVGRDGTATVTVRLRGGTTSGVGSVRVLVDDNVEALPVPLVVSDTT
jgi:lysophospholipase L1-like esterase